MRIHPSQVLLTVFGLALPGLAYAQQISPLIAALAISPVLVFALAIAVGLLSRSWPTGIAHFGLVAIWILLFGVASYWVENDLIIWTPLALYVLHSGVLAVLLLRGLRRRDRG